MIDKGIIEQVRDAANIVEVVSDYIQLTKKGVNYVGLCPFHDDTHPSMVVSPNRGMYHCFACGEKGDAIHFIQDFEKLSFPQAVRHLAIKYGIVIPSKERTEEEKKAQRLRNNLLKTNAWVADFYQRSLQAQSEESEVKRYLQYRGLSEEIVSKFHIGYSPADVNLFASAYKAEGLYFNNAKLLGLGEIRRNGVIDRLAGRIVFPWLDVEGNVIGFAGRKLDERTKGVEQKYINSLDSEVYHKGEELYGLYQSKYEIVRQDKVLLVEGYTDVFAFHQVGVQNVVSCSGTCLSIKQVNLLKRFTQNAVLMFDGDNAGRKAILTTMGLCMSSGMNVSVVQLPEGEDPDSFVKGKSKEEVETFLHAAEKDFFGYLCAQLELHAATIAEKAAGITEIIRFVNMSADPVMKDLYYNELVACYGVSRRSIEQILEKEAQWRNCVVQ